MIMNTIVLILTVWILVISYADAAPPTRPPTRRPTLRPTIKPTAPAPSRYHLFNYYYYYKL